MKNVSWILLILLFVACTGGDPEEQTVNKEVDILTKDIFTPISFTVDGNEVGSVVDLDEYLNDSGQLVITIFVKNNTAFPMTELDVEFNDAEGNEWAFIETPDGKREFPGYEGTCLETLESGESCLIKLGFETSISGRYTQRVTFLYKNLVDPDNRVVDFTIYAGYPASLVYDEPIEDFFFGDRIGSSETPVVERSLLQTYTKTYTVRNGGELRARNVRPILQRSCTSAFDGSCPAGHEEAYQYETDCPDKLYAGEFCQVTVSFTPMNQDPVPGPTPPALEYITYDGIMRFEYASDPLYNPGALNGYFSTVSTYIQAILETSIESLIFEEPQISGNRIKKSFRVNNVGFRHGELQKFIFKDKNSGLHMATCKAGANNDYLTCYNEAEDRVLDHWEFPFFVADEDDCFQLPRPQEEANFLEIEQGCVYQLYFQPSNMYHTAKLFEILLELEYDSRWKDQERITTNYLHEVKAESLNAAKINLLKLDYDGSDMNIPVGSCDDIKWTSQSSCEGDGDTWTVGGVCSNDSYTNKLDCEGNGAIWNRPYCYEPLDITEAACIADSGTWKSGRCIYMALESLEDCENNAKFYELGYCSDNTKDNFIDCENAGGQWTSLSQADHGRLALLSPTFYFYRGFQAMFVNQGGVDAFDLTYQDGSGRIIPDTDQDIDGAPIGNHLPSYYDAVKVNAALCRLIPPGGACSIQMDFATIGLTTGVMEQENMFDYIDPSDESKNYKSWKVYYRDGSEFSDSNLYTDIQDTPVRVTEARVNATLVRVGLIGDTNDMEMNTRNDPAITDEYEGVVLGNKVQQTIVMRNIGTGPVKYLTWNKKDIFGNPNDATNYPEQPLFYEGSYPSDVLPDDDLNAGFDAIPTSNLSYYNAQYDCLNVVDIGFQGKYYTPAIEQEPLADIQARSASWSALPKDEACALTMEFKPTNRFILPMNDPLIFDPIFNPIAGTGATGDSGIARPFSHAINNTDAVWLMDKSVGADNRPMMAYWDGDNTNPLLTDEIDQEFGSRVGDWTKGATYKDPDFIFRVYAPTWIGPQLPKPEMQAVLYRPQIDYPDLYVDAEKIYDGFTFPEQYFFGANETAVGSPNNAFFMAQEAVTHVQGVLTAGDKSTYDYILHAGTYPTNSNTVVGFTLRNYADGFFESKIVEQKEIPIDTVFTPLFPAVDESDDTTWRQINPGPPGEVVNFRFSPTAAGSYKTSYRVKWQTGVYTNGVNEDDGIETRTLNILVIAEAIDDPVIMKLTEYDYDIVPQESAAPEETFNPTPVVRQMGLNSGGQQPEHVTKFNIIKLDERDAVPNSVNDPTEPVYRNGDDIYLRKRFVFKNQSATTRMNNLEISFKSTPTAEEGMDITSDSLTIDFNTCFAVLNRTPEVYLDPGEECTMEIWYQPVKDDVTISTYLVSKYEIAPNQYAYQHHQVRFEPRDPALLIAKDLATKKVAIYFEGSPVAPPMYPLDMGEVIHTANPQVVEFSGGGTTQAMVQIINTESLTRASLLRAYHEYLIDFDPTYDDMNPPPLSAKPDPGDYIPKGGQSVAVIARTEYPNGDPHILVEASEGCLIGEDDPALEHFQKGFVADTFPACYLVFTNHLDFNYIGRTLMIDNPDDMTPNYIRLGYYNNDRSSWDYIYFNFEGSVVPNPSFKGGGEDYFEVFTTETKTASFKWSGMTVDQTDLGAIVGYRVYMSENMANLQDLMNISAPYFDVPTPEFFIDTNMLNGKFYYFVVAPIRYHVDYTFGLFPGLGTGQYVSPSDIQILKVLIPASGWFYDHALKITVSKDMYDYQLRSYSETLSTCSSAPQVFLDDSGVVNNYPQRVITMPAWDLIRDNWYDGDQAFTNYDLMGYSHWIRAPFVDITEEITPLNDPMFDAGAESMQLPDSNIFFIRKNGCFTCKVPIAKGRMLASPFEDYTNYIGDDITYGMPRCMVEL
jgi:hypothetical protein